MRFFIIRSPLGDRIEIEMKNKLAAIGQMLINIALAPMYFIKFFHEVGVFPGEASNGSFITYRRDFYYSA